MCFFGALLPSFQHPKKYNISKKSTMPDIQYPDLYPPTYYSPPRLDPRIVDETQQCTCEECVFARLYQRMDINSSHEPESAKSDPRHHLSKMRDGQKNSPKKSYTEPQKKHQRPDAHPLAATTMAYPEVYIYPGTSHHITFPVVDYSTRQRVEKQGPWPACFLAISPECSKPADFEATLCPQGSKLIVVARLSRTKKTAPLSAFKDADELRRDSIQLEIWDEDAAKPNTKNGHGSEAKADVRDGINGAEIGIAKKEKKGRNKG
ncbi:hypothetical protein F5Y06DRAFT_173339 [Hypoxylon sp. FL0890]|nr:hypothetical protein F5Y06DRAFT_173339 [Hypoxylon sp. FL0890]